MKILLTGGAGYIGSHTAVELLCAGYDVVIADDFSNSSRDAITGIEKTAGKTVNVIEADLSQPGGADAALSGGGIDAVIHFAGFKAVGESVQKPLEYYRNNLLCTIYLLTSMARYGVKNIIFSSSATVYGEPKSLPLTEDMEDGRCTNPYGETKQMIEHIIKDAAVADSELSAVLLRYFNPAGAHPDGHIGERPSGIPNNLMPYITQVAAGRLKELRVFGDDYPTPDGTGIRDYIHVVDLARGHVKALEYCVKNKGAQTINLGTGRGVSVLEMIAAFERANGVKIPYSIAPRRDGDIPECWADASKAKNVLGWQAEQTLDDMCRDAWNWERRV